MIVDSQFNPAWWLPGPHCQTIWPALFRRRISIPLTRERLELPDGDFIDLDWAGYLDDKPIVILLHGLEGSINSSYATGMVQAIHHQQCNVVFMHFRGCSGEHNRLARAYHSVETEDIAYLVRVLQQRYPNSPLAAVGYSLGGNVLLKWLGETGHDNPLHCAVAISVPFLLNRLADKMNEGFSKVYQWRLVRQLKTKFLQKQTHTSLPIDSERLATLKSFWEFDDQVTAPLHAFASAKDYYAKSSCRRYLKGIRVPTLIVHAKDDPFMMPEVIPSADELSNAITLELAKRDGHNGFVAGQVPGRAHFWLDERIPQHLMETSFCKEL